MTPEEQEVAEDYNLRMAALRHEGLMLQKLQSVIRQQEEELIKAKKPKDEPMKPIIPLEGGKQDDPSA